MKWECKSCNHLTGPTQWACESCGQKKDTKGWVLINEDHTKNNPAKEKTMKDFNISSNFAELTSLDFSIHQFSQSLKTMLALLFTQSSIDPLIAQLDQLKTCIGRWGLEDQSCTEVISAINHLQKALKIEDKVN